MEGELITLSFETKVIFLLFEGDFHISAILLLTSASFHGILCLVIFLLCILTIYWNSFKLFWGERSFDLLLFIFTVGVSFICLVFTDTESILTFPFYFCSSYFFNLTISWSYFTISYYSTATVDYLINFTLQR